MNEPKPRAEQRRPPESAAQPHDADAERSVLGAVLLDPKVMNTLGNKLGVEDFYLESNRCIYRAMLELDEANEPIDTIMVAKQLRELGLLAAAGGPAELAQLAVYVPTAANIDHYASIVKEKSVLRQVLAFAAEVAHTARGEVEDVPRFVDEVAQRAMNLSTTGMVPSIVTLREALVPALDLAERMSLQKHRSHLTGVTSGFHALDRMTFGWQPSDLIILAARPGMGKTAFALNILINAARDTRAGTPGVIFSLEMSKEQLATRLWCSETRVPMETLRGGDYPSAVWGNLLTGFETLSKAPVFIDDTAAIPVTEMMRKCRQLKHEHDIGLIIVDYLQLMSASQLNRGASREQQISEISRNLKQLAKELHVPVIALSQLNRSVESRPNKRPLLSDLRESGAIEQDADIIVFLYREDYYAQMKGGDEVGGKGAPPPRPVSSPDASSMTEVILAKHRSGATGKVELLFHPPFTLFTNMEHDPTPPPRDGDRLPHDG